MLWLAVKDSNDDGRPYLQDKDKRNLTVGDFHSYASQNIRQV